MIRVCKIILSVAAMVFITNCSSDTQYTSQMASAMEEIEALVLSNPRKALVMLDSLNLDTSKILLKNYYKLNKIYANANLFCVEADKEPYVEYVNLKEIEQLYNYYKEEYDKVKKKLNSKKFEIGDYNYAKASLLYGIVRYEYKRDDITAYRYLKRAQSFFDTHPQHNHYRAFLYYALAKVNGYFGNISATVNYYNKSISLLKDAHDVNHIPRISMRMANILFIVNDYVHVKSIIDTLLEQKESLDAETLFEIYLMKSAISASEGDYEVAHIAMENANKEKKNLHTGNKNWAMENLIASKYYLSINNLDSALCYADKAVKSSILKDDYATDNINKDFYYRNLADVYFAAGKFELAAQTYKNASNNHLYGATISSNAVNKGLEKAYNDTIEKINIHNQWWDTYLTYTMLALLIVLLLVIILVLVFRLRIGTIEKEKDKLQKIMMEEQMYQSKSIIDIVSISLGMLPKFVEKINELSAKTFTTDPKLYDVFQKEITAVKIETRKHFLDLINNDAFKAANPVLQYLGALSNQEKMIVLLLKQNYSTKYISNVLNTSQSSVRASKVKIKAKIRDAQIPQNIKDELLKLFA